MRWGGCWCQGIIESVSNNNLSEFRRLQCVTKKAICHSSKYGKRKFLKSILWLCCCKLATKTAVCASCVAGELCATTIVMFGIRRTWTLVSWRCQKVPSAFTCDAKGCDNTLLLDLLGTRTGWQNTLIDISSQDWCTSGLPSCTELEKDPQYRLKNRRKFKQDLIRLRSGHRQANREAKLSKTAGKKGWSETRR